MKFFKINKEQFFYKYMINEPQTIFNDFVPGAFEGIKYQERIKHKTLNEINNKVKELKKLEYCLKDKKNIDPAFLPQLRKFFKENNLGMDREPS